MGSTVKKIAKVAIVAAAAYYGGTALMSSFATAAPTVGSTAFWTGTSSGFLGGTGFAAKLAGSAFNYLKANPLTSASLILQGGGMAAQNKYATSSANYAKVAADAQRETNVVNQRKSEVNARKVAIAKQQEMYILQGRNTMAQGGFGQAGTSSYTGTQGALSTDYASVIGDLNVQRDFSASLSQQNQIYGDAKSNQATAEGFASGASNITTAGMNIFKTISGGDNGLYARTPLTAIT
jgi:hypothetical protein|tara:strand:+ start:1483 stop:2193 length:711 start_codon:yes stop_codon:yes gene_type:complete